MEVHTSNPLFLHLFILGGRRGGEAEAASHIATQWQHQGQGSVTLAMPNPPHSPLHRSLTHPLGHPWLAPLRALRQMRQEQPDLVLCTGGAWQSLLAAIWPARRVIWHIGGRAAPWQRLLHPFFDGLLLGLPDPRPQGARAQGTVTGIPVAPSLWRLPSNRRREALPLRIMVLAGTASPERLDTLMMAVARALPPPIGRALRVRHYSATAKAAPLLRAYAAAGVRALHATQPFDAAEAYHWADLVITQPGPVRCAELAVVGCPCILVPAQGPRRAEHLRNARILHDTGLAWVASDLVSPQRQLLHLLQHLVEDPQSLRRKAGRRLGFSSPQAAERCSAAMVLAYAGRDKDHFGEALGTWWLALDKFSS